MRRDLRIRRLGGWSAYTQLLNHAQLLLQYIRQAEQLAEAIKQTADMIKNTLEFALTLFIQDKSLMQ